MSSEEGGPITAEAPVGLASGPVELRFDSILPGDDTRGLVPAYHFKIIADDGAIVGHINLRVGSTRHVTMTAGHVGYEILPPRRGSAYAYHACAALAPLVRRHYERAILTVDPENAPSIRTIERLGATFIDEVEVPADHPAYEKGARRKRRYEWLP